MDLEKMRDTKNLNELERVIVDRLSNVIDPELGVDLINLGLIYRADLTDEGILKILLTLTTPMCPMADVIIDELNETFVEVPQVEEVEVTITFDPPWSLDKLSRYAKIALGVM
ncbi:metal-sulfur cluster assembly factor [Facklamia miroungae]|uniref:Metal-sulfur cluster biosynthetic enzyme n=1 Tax=Facklamia miroungae TaxID=120956 RepID=A0A1G7P2E7_9LACT|nr:metal-sulfur cluster assembly factor [Facklamia miroungae]NKZ28553.1 metal-sulfur cluster assembly factor [Facklamia miroungae]SDF80277.1 Metal-sulfur cluster biosynthetic enzyme [Facklamia miroungae]